MTEELVVTNITTIEKRIFTIRGQKVMLDRDLAELYEVGTKRLNEAVKRNAERFPSDFMFQLTQEEWDILRSQFATADESDNLVSQISQDEKSNLRSQIATSSYKHGGRRYTPYAFTEHGILMLSNVLNSARAVSVSIQIIRVFNNLRKYALEQTYKDERIEELRKLLLLHIENCDTNFAEHDEAIKHIIQVLNNFIEKPPTAKRIGFNAG